VCAAPNILDCRIGIVDKGEEDWRNWGIEIGDSEMVYFRYKLMFSLVLVIHIIVLVDIITGSMVQLTSVSSVALPSPASTLESTFHSIIFKPSEEL
jgi:hypothetical protein